MKNIFRLGVMLLTVFQLTGCVLFHGYAPAVQQGNVITHSNVQKLQIGMTPYQVLAIMGTPVLTNAFRDNTWNYVYTYQIYSHRLHEKQAVITFSNGVVSKIQTKEKVYIPPKPMF